MCQPLVDARGSAPNGHQGFVPLRAKRRMRRSGSGRRCLHILIYQTIIHKSITFVSAGSIAVQDSTPQPPANLMWRYRDRKCGI
jgi:hypothetical protein